MVSSSCQEISDTVQDAYRKIPAHWDVEFHEAWSWLRPPLKWTFGVLILVSFGRKNLKDTWETIQSHDEDEFRPFADKTAARISTITVITGLLLSCLITIVTTTPPVGTIFNYTLRVPYLCLCTACGTLFGGLIIGFCDIFVIGTWRAQCLQKLMATRIQAVSVLIFLAYPFFAMFSATLLSVYGILVAAWLSHDSLVQFGCVVLFLVPTSTVFPFVILQLKRSLLPHYDGSTTGENA
ncbi:hypothetical protein BDY19DRAFT_270418 [Irpex rosettiformis]|uniref:Uncharacterized protein n=1 Tax=Irpex rosettiformis TaxID=378272 RepID=A0ACB8UHG3_9APHY|nr:hypothetical protein BDY19DRAFT_270418 [Irpex rosettiformis]